MPYRLVYDPRPDLPRLAWLASIDRAEKRIQIICGPAVERREQWLVEGVWDGRFEEGRFHDSLAFFGSGLRAEGDKVYISASSASVDRVLFCEMDGRLIASNSLILLLAHTGARLDDQHDYWKDTLSILRGMDRYDPRFRVIHPSLDYFEQLYYQNLVLSPQGLCFQARDRELEPKLENFDDYHGALFGCLSRIWENLASPQRQAPLTPLVTVSEGYDSTAVAAMASELGAETAFVGNSVDPPLYGLIDKRANTSQVWRWNEDAGPIARTLGLRELSINGGRASIGPDELYFLAGPYPKRHSSPWSELAFHGMAAYIEKNCQAAVVFTGYHGDMVWGLNTPDKYVADVVRRKDLSGLNLTEIRLKAGFINAAVPFIMARRIERIMAISRSPEMAPWRVHTDYDRPIPRRIAETRGVPRRAFGQEKKFVADRYMWPVNPDLQREFFGRLRARQGIGRGRVYLEYAANLAPAQALLRLLGISKSRKDYFFMGPEIDLYYLMNHWAVEKLTKRTAAVLARGGAGRSC